MVTLDVGTMGGGKTTLKVGVGRKVSGNKTSGAVGLVGNRNLDESINYITISKY